MSLTSIDRDSDSDTECLSVEEAAKYFVERLLQTAVNEVRNLGVEVYVPARYEPVKCPVRWPTCGSFTPEVGLQKIDEYIRSWSKNAEMMYCADYIDSKRDSRCDFYFYEAATFWCLCGSCLWRSTFL